MKRKANWTGKALLALLIAFAAGVFLVPSHGFADGIPSDLGLSISLNGSKIDLADAEQYDIERTDGKYYRLLQGTGSGSITVDSMNTKASDNGCVWSLDSVYHGRVEDHGLYCYLHFRHIRSDGYWDDQIGIQLGGYSIQVVRFDTGSSVMPAGGESAITWPDGWSWSAPPTSELSDVEVKFWNLMDSSLFVPAGFDPTKSCNISVSGYAVPYLGNSVFISDLSKHLNETLPDGWAATCDSLDKGDGTTVLTCNVVSASDSNVSVTWEFTYNPKLPCTSKSEYLTDTELNQRANIALYQGSNKILWYKANDWAQYEDVVIPGADVTVRTSGVTDQWYLGVTFVSSTGGIFPSGWADSRNKPCSYDDPDITYYNWYMESKTTGCVYGASFKVAKNVFADVNNGTAHYDDIVWLAAKGISTGWTASDGTKTFRPYSEVARADMAAFLYRLAGSPEYTAPSTSPFKDVTTSTPHYKEICWLADKGISAGWSVSGGKEFRPYQTVARCDMAAFLYRLAGSPAYSAQKTSPFKDVSSSTPHYKEVCWLAESGVSAGWAVSGGKEFRAYNTVARADMAAFLHRMKTKELI